MITLGKKLKQSEDGALSVELALSLPIFLMVTVGAMEFSWYFFMASSLENAVLHASRYGVTGATTENISRADRVRQIIDEQTFGRLNMDDLELTTEVYEQFSDIDAPEPFEDANGDETWTTGEVFTDVNGNGIWDESLAIPGLGGGNDIVLYTARYQPGSLTGIFDWITESTIIEATIAVRNEPY